MTLSRSKRAVRLAAVAALLAVMLPQATAIAADETISIGSSLSPKELTITPGTNVTWVNDDGERHRVRSETGPEEFDSGNLDPGESYTFNFAIEGTYTYIDDRNEDDTAYHGTITVAADAPPPDPGDPPPPAPAAGDVNIVDRSFQPASLTIGEGGSVTWANNDDDEHTVTATDSSWDSGIFGDGATFSRTFADPGTYAYFCIIHPDMTGTITVTSETGEPPPDPDPPPPSPAPSPPPAPASGDVTIFDFGFTPGDTTVTVGATITWANTGAAPHTVTDAAGGFDSGFLFAGDTYTRTFDVVGTYDYICTLHPEMTGTVVVQGADGEPPPPAPTDPDPPPGSSPTPAVSGDITIVDNAFSPRTKTVATGTTVAWANTGVVPHTVTSGSGGFDSGFIMSGETYRRTFGTPGTYDYVCTIHPGMTGTLVVTGEATGEPVPGDGGSAEPWDPSAADVGLEASEGSSSVSIVDNDFSPRSVTVSAGSQVTWSNDGALPHTVTSDTGGFDSGILTPGAGFAVRLTTPGTYDYVCTLHPEMTGTIVVTEATAPIEGGDGAAVIESGTDSAGGAEDASGATPASGPTVARTVQMIDNAFQPATVSVAAGEAVRWRNDGLVPHTATLDGVFDSGFLEPGADFVQAFDSVGVYEYICTIHPEMVGIIEVTEPVADVATAGINPGAAAPLDPAVALLMAGGIVLAVGVMAFGMARFARAASEMR